MARASNANPLDDKARSAGNASADAGAGALRAAAADGRRKRGGARRSKSRIARLTGMCNEAADHLSSAHSALYDEAQGGETALTHLDAALDCLKRIAAEGDKERAKSGAQSGGKASGKAKSA